MTAKHKIVDGKTTPIRLKEEFENLVDSGERITVVEFARRVQISPHTLNHRYRDWAEKLRKLRDEGRAKPRKHSPMIVGQKHFESSDEVENVILQLRQQVNALSSQVVNLQEKCEKLQERVRQGEQAKEQNERLRGVLISLQQEIVRYMTTEQSSRLLLMIEEHAAIPSQRNS